jgi:Cu-Zn family superoxide dismutase
MKPSVLASVTAVAAVGFSTLTLAAAPAPTPPTPLVVPLHALDGAPVGEVRLTQRPMGLAVSATVRGLAPGFHGFHLHENASCASAPDVPFSGAGGHYRVGDVPHGQHAGDLPPLLVNLDGAGRGGTLTDRVDLKTLLGRGGAFIVHAGPDNLAHIPERYTAAGAPAPGADAMTRATGDAGGRVACGVVGG